MQISGAAAASYTAPSQPWSMAPAAARPTTAEQAFDDYAKKTPAQKMRDEILGSMGLTEEKLAAMDPKERAKVEAKIKTLIKQKVEQEAEKKTGVIIDLKA